MTTNLKHTTGDLLKLASDGEFNIIVHGANCFNAMGGGIARQIAEQYPDAVAADDAFGPPGDIGKLGNYSVMLGKRFNIINAYTQFTTSSGGDEFEYAAFELILRKLAYNYPGCRFGFPLIGQGLAGGDAARIMPMIHKFADDMAETFGTVTLVQYEAP